MHSIRIMPISALLLGLFLSAVGNGLQGTLVPLRAGIEGFAAAAIGGMMSAYFVGYTLGALAAPGLIHRVGHIRTFAAFASLASVVTLLHLVVVDPWLWTIFRTLNGLCICVLSVVIESWLNGHALPDHRGKILSLAGLTTVLAIALGQLLLNFSGPESFVLFCVVSIAISLALVPVSLTRSSAPGVEQHRPFRVRKMFSQVPWGLTGVFLTGATMSAFLGMGPTYVQLIGGGLDTRGISLFMAFLMFGAVCLQWPLGWISDRVDRRLVIAAALALNLLVCASFLLFARQSLVVLLPLAFVLDGLGQSLYALFAARVNDVVSPGQVLATASSLLLVFGIGSVIGPFVASLMMAQLGPNGLFWLLALLYAVTLTVIFCDISAHRSQAQEKRENTFVSMYFHVPMGNVSESQQTERADLEATANTQRPEENL